MALVDWKQVYEVNIQEIDSQHKKLVKLINELHEAMMMGKAKEAMSKILSDVVDYTVYHFGTEEKYFDQYDYPESDIHKKQHAELVEQVAALQKKFEAGERVLTIDVMNFLRDWLHDHIVGSDTKFGPYLNGKGVN
ncbi:MAG: bacteriohemerythrin [Melioribacteraceae bacterium]|nr:bacteriohemerythrin [Melioribacteraceae bacterium]MCF8264828.1 bacteriohemerythrin [Melioribacteraceae bacterium]